MARKIDTTHTATMFGTLHPLLIPRPPFDMRSTRRDLLAMGLLVRALASKDHYTAAHSRAVQEIARLVAKAMGVEVGHAGLMHDIGKLNVPDAILRKPDKLTKVEFDIVRQHSLHGYQLLLPISPNLAMIVLLTHERPDGTGYPFGLKEVPVESGIVAAADTLHALVSDRPYCPRRSFGEAMAVIHEVSGSQLRTDVVRALDRIQRKLGELLDRLAPSAVPAVC